MSDSIPCRIACYFHISPVQHTHLSDGEDFGTILSLAWFINVEQELWYESEGLRVSLDLGRIQVVNLFVVLHCI